MGHIHASTGGGQSGVARGGRDGLLVDIICFQRCRTRDSWRLVEFIGLEGGCDPDLVQLILFLDGAGRRPVVVAEQD